MSDQRCGVQGTVASVDKGGQMPTRTRRSKLSESVNPGHKDHVCSASASKVSIMYSTSWTKVATSGERDQEIRVNTKRGV